MALVDEFKDPVSIAIQAEKPALSHRSCSSQEMCDVLPTIEGESLPSEAIAPDLSLQDTWLNTYSIELHRTAEHSTWSAAEKSSAQRQRNTSLGACPIGIAGDRYPNVSSLLLNADEQYRNRSHHTPCNASRCDHQTSHRKRVQGSPHGRAPSPSMPLTIQGVSCLSVSVRFRSLYGESRNGRGKDPPVGLSDQDFPPVR